MNPHSRPLSFPALEACEPAAPPPEFEQALLDGESTSSNGDLSQAVLTRLSQFVQLVLAGNRLMNLTALRTSEAVWTGLVLDSLRVAPGLANLPPGSRVVDVGCGAGFPGIPLAILFPNLHFTLVDATAKKVAFVSHACQQLALVNVEPVCGRAEQLASGSESRGHCGPLREHFDLVTARAVAPLPLLLELTVPFARAPSATQQGGRLLLVKGEKADTELSQATRAMQHLSVAHLDTRLTPSSRLLLFQKLRPTAPRFPRPNGAPKRNPL